MALTRRYYLQLYAITKIVSIIILILDQIV